MPDAWLFITEGFHVPVIPLPEVVGNSGGVFPAHIGGIAGNVGMKIGLDKTIPIKRSVVQPFICREKFEYSPAFKLGIIN